MEQTKKITKMKQETKATIAYLAAIIFVIICIALMAGVTLLPILRSLELSKKNDLK